MGERNAMSVHHGIGTNITQFDPTYTVMPNRENSYIRDPNTSIRERCDHMWNPLSHGLLPQKEEQVLRLNHSKQHPS